MPAVRPFGAGRQNRCAVSPPLLQALQSVSDIEGKPGLLHILELGQFRQLVDLQSLA